MPPDKKNKAVDLTYLIECSSEEVQKQKNYEKIEVNSNGVYYFTIRKQQKHYWNKFQVMGTCTFITVIIIFYAFSVTPSIVIDNLKKVVHFFVCAFCTNVF